MTKLCLKFWELNNRHDHDIYLSITRPTISQFLVAQIGGNRDIQTLLDGPILIVQAYGYQESGPMDGSVLVQCE